MATKVLPRPIFLDLLQLLSAYSSLQLIYQNSFTLHTRIRLLNIGFVFTSSVSLALTLFRLIMLRDSHDRLKKYNAQIYISLTASMASWMFILHGTALYYFTLDSKLEPQTVN